jgi:hypothetical protein
MYVQYSLVYHSISFSQDLSTQQASHESFNVSKFQSRKEIPFSPTYCAKRQKKIFIVKTNTHQTGSNMKSCQLSSLGIYIVLLVIFLQYQCLAKPGSPINCKKMCTGYSSSPCKVQDPIGLMVELNNSIDPPRYYDFCVKVDQFTVLNLEGSASFMNASVNSTVTIYIGFDESSGPRYYMESDGSAVVSNYEVLIGLSNGVFPRNNNTYTNIVFDNTCQSGICSLDRTAPCVRGVDCGIPMSQIISQSVNNTAVADVKMYLAWEGTDKNDVALQSANMLPSLFRAYAFTSYYQQLYNIAVPFINSRTFT